MEEKEDTLIPPAPWLVYTHWNDKAEFVQTKCCISSVSPNEISYDKRVPECGERDVLAAFDKWLVLCDHENRRQFSLWNIATSQYIQLPFLDALAADEISDDDDDGGDGDDNDNDGGDGGDVNDEGDHEEDEISTCILLSAPDDEISKNCRLLVFHKAEVCTCRITNGRASSWVKQNTQLDGEKLNINSTIICNGVLYGWAESDNGLARSDNCDVLITINFATGDPNLLIIEPLGVNMPVFGPCVHSHEYLPYFVESCGGLFLVVVRMRHFETMQISNLKVWELDFNLMVWTEVNCLGDRAFLLGMHSCTWCWAGTEPESLNRGIQGNCVYFVLEHDPTLYQYRLKDDSFSYLLPCPNLPTSFCGHAWVMPQDQRLIPRDEGKYTTEKVGLSNQINIIYEDIGLQEENEVQGKLQSELPPDVIALISKYLHLFDYLNFRASCKMFQSILSPPVQGQSNFAFPLFMFSENGDGLCKLKDILRDDSQSIMIPHSPQVPACFEFSKDGWLVVCTGSDSLQFFNPYTRMKGEYPPYQVVHFFASIGFSTCPISSDCVTVAIVDGWKFVSLNYFRSSDRTWKSHDFDHGDIEFVPSHSSPVHLNGAFYFLDQSGYLGVFEIVKEEASWKVYDKPLVTPDSHCSSHLFECDGDLLSVSISKTGTFVSIFKFNHSEKDWIEVKSLGSNMLFMSPSSTSAMKAMNLRMRNRIYLPWRSGEDIAFYSLETGKYHTASCEEPMEDVYGMTGQSLCCWV